MLDTTPFYSFLEWPDWYQGTLFSDNPYLSVSVRMQENADQKNTEYGHFLLSFDSFLSKFY